MLCGGSIISQRHGLTSAECVNDYTQITLEAGMVSIESSISRLIISANAIIHYAWQPGQINNNIAILLIAQPISFNSYISSVALPPNTTNTYDLYEGFVSGFGKEYDEQNVFNELLKFTKIRIINNTLCASKFPNGGIIATQICADGYDNLWTGICYGDSGSPVVVQEGGIFRVIGIVNILSSGGCNQPHPFVNTRISSFRTWITCVTGL